jgi:uncharacterized protein
LTRLVIDASVLLVAPVGRPDGSPALLIEAARSRVIEMIVCPTLLAEFERGLASSYFQKRVLPAERTMLVDLLRSIATVVDDPESPPRVVRDPHDDYLVALAAATGAEAIVTADADLPDHDGLLPPAWTARAACDNLRLREQDSS